MKTPFNTFVLMISLCVSSHAFAQRGGGRGGPRRPPAGMGQADQAGLNQAGRNQAGLNQGGLNQGGQNQVQNQNMPSVQQLAQMMIARFDADGSGELGQAELQSGLEALRQMMMQNRQGNGGQQNQQNAFADGQIVQDRGRGFQGEQAAQANRPPRGQRGQAGRGRGR